jgi:hypothetical protein
VSAAAPRPEHEATLSAISAQRSAWYADARAAVLVVLARAGEAYSRDVARQIAIGGGPASHFPLRYRISFARRVLGELEREGVLVSRVVNAPSEPRWQRRYYRQVGT